MPSEDATCNSWKVCWLGVRKREERREEMGRKGVLMETGK
jgi:hypothetical protein|tara:strand:- start:257 stop:376 length:120 start_codon:yes stop_codon:yes gene_type:complete